MRDAAPTRATESINEDEFMKIVAAGLALCVSFAVWSASRADGELPPGGSAWVRVPIDGAGKPRGYVEYEKYCSACHAAGPEARPGYTALQARYKGALPAALPDRKDLAADYVEYVVRNGLSIMPRARKTEISEAELDAIAAYLTRNNPSN
jgi:mono/diheme cytochrome c family protein